MKTPQTKTPTIGEVVGRNVRELREQNGWSQRDLLWSLRLQGFAWNRAAIGQLELAGASGERLGELAAICAAFDVPLWRLLQSESVRVRHGKDQTAEWLIDSLQGELPGTRPTIEELRGPHLHLDDPEANSELLRKSGLSEGHMAQLIKASVRALDAPSDVRRSTSKFRDWLAQVDSSMDKKTVAALRGHAARRILSAAKLWADSGPSDIDTLRRVLIDEDIS